MVENAGSVGALAAFFDVAPMTLRNWSQGLSVPSSFTQKAVNEQAKRWGIAPPFPLSP
jgi:hypothetical protein